MSQSLKNRRKQRSRPWAHTEEGRREIRRQHLLQPTRRLLTRNKKFHRFANPRSVLPSGYQFVPSIFAVVINPSHPIPEYTYKFRLLIIYGLFHCRHLEDMASPSYRVQMLYLSLHSVSPLSLLRIFGFRSWF